VKQEQEVGTCLVCLKNTKGKLVTQRPSIGMDSA